ncbi:hypothetical protein ACFV2B_31825, partial [Streptomyces lavendulae]|uniref:hypothetical protein n=1 Tax=Streptomyces lavendulae TaxID=1914 RepID=UPI0036A20778
AGAARRVGASRGSPYSSAPPAAADPPAHGSTADRLRSFYLSQPLRQELARWEEANHANGVLRAQNVPVQWKVTSTGSGTGKTNATVTLTWGGGDTTQVHVQADLKTKKITSITG